MCQYLIISGFVSSDHLYKLVAFRYHSKTLRMGGGRRSATAASFHAFLVRIRIEYISRSLARSQQDQWKEMTTRTYNVDRRVPRKTTVDRSRNCLRVCHPLHSDWSDSSPSNLSRPFAWEHATCSVIHYRLDEVSFPLCILERSIMLTRFTTTY